MTKGIIFRRRGWVYAVMLALSIYGCSRNTDVEDQLNLSDSLMENHPDSALSILDNIDESGLGSDKNKARYALLKTMALDKNAIDTTTFDVLQPAIDYYLKNGNGDEKLRIHYYQGRIYENAGDDDLAMQVYLNGLEDSEAISDSLTLARLLVAQAVLYYKAYQIEEVVANNLNAASLYGRLGRQSQELKCYLRALQGDVILKNQLEADSIYKICKTIVKDSEPLKKNAQRALLLYAVGFGEDEDIKSLIAEVEEAGITDDMKMNLARAYGKIGNPEVGLRYLNEAKISPDNILDSLTYWSVKTEILENLGEDIHALDAFRNYSRVLEIYHDQLFSNELLFSEKKHEMEIENMAKLRKKDNAIKWILVGVIVLVVAAVLIYYRYRLNKAGRLLAERNAENLQLEGEKQRLLAEKLDAEGRELLQKNETLRIEEERQRLLAEKLESERARLRLEAENLHHKVEEMEGEQTRLKELLDSQETLSEEGRQLIRERIGLLNGLIAQALTEQESYGKEFKSYIAKIKKDRNGFQESLVKMFETTHPDFMAYLRQHDLTDRELRYACLYAMGMRGKEIGTYLDLARHYNISTEVRRKLGLDPNDRNLGPFLRSHLTRHK